MTQSELITTTQAVEILGGSRWSIYRRMKAGELKPVFKSPGSTSTYFFERQDVLALAESAAAA